MNERSDSFQRAIAELYVSPLADFIRSRDGLAKELRSSGDRDAASEVKSLRKPSRQAWALNRVVNHAPDSLSALEEAVAGIVDAHSGTGDVRTAMATLRAAVRECATNAASESRIAGFSLDVGELSNAILAVLGSPSTYDEFRSGRLTDIPEAGGLEFLTSLSARPKFEVSGPSPSPAEVDPAEVAAVREQARLASEALEAARSAAEAAAASLNEAESELAAAREKARLAESELKAAEQRREFARRTNESASADLRTAEAASKEAERRLMSNS
jgi:hypothetical protein